MIKIKISLWSKFILKNQNTNLIQHITKQGITKWDLTTVPQTIMEQKNSDLLWRAWKICMLSDVLQQNDQSENYYNIF